MANLKMVSIAGVDDGVKPSELQALTEEFPFVEWGVIFTRNSCGLRPRYPSLRWMAELDEYSLPVCMHLSGKIVRKVAPADGPVDFKPIYTAISLLESLKRIQLNLSPYVPDWATHQTELDSFANANNLSFILQTGTFDHPSVRAGTWDAGASNPDYWTAISFLHDASGGKGLIGEFEAPVKGAFTGYAGGISPENLTETMDRIYATGIDQPFWIDMESGVRTEDQFDLDKVRSVLEQARIYMG